MRGRSQTSGLETCSRARPAGQFFQFRGKRPRSPAGDPMTLGNMRANGVRSLDVRQYHHEAVLSADRWPDHMPVPAFGPRMDPVPSKPSASFERA